MLTFSQHASSAAKAPYRHQTVAACIALASDGGVENISQFVSENPN